MNKYDEEYLNQKIEAYSKAHPEGSEEHLKMTSMMRSEGVTEIEERADRYIDIEKAHKAFVELLAVQYGEDCDESMHQYIDDALIKAMEE